MNTTELIEAAPTQVGPFQGKAEKLLARVKGAVIDSPEKATGGADLLKYIKGQKSALEERRLAMTKPFREGVAALNAMFKPVETQLEQAQKILGEKMVAFQNQERLRLEDEARKEREKAKAAEEERMRKLREEQAAAIKAKDQEAIATTAAKMAEPPPVQTALPTKAPAVKGSTGATFQVRKTWTYQVTDANAVPIKYMAPDDAKIKAAIGEGARNIPGLYIFEKSIPVSS